MNTVKSTFFQIIKRKETPLFLVLITAGITLCGWIFDNIALVSFSLKYKPISPIIAVTFIVLSILIYINLNFEKSRLTKSLVTLLFIIITLFYFIVVLGYVFNFAHGIENVFVKNADRYGSALTGYMSPIAALLGISICISSLLVSRNYSDIIKYFGGSITLLVFLFSSVLLIAYLYNAPLLFGSQVVPVALPAVVCFLLFSITLLRIYELKFWTFNLIKDNTIALQLLKSFLPIVVFAVIVQGLLITNFPIAYNSTTLSVALVLFIIVAVIIFIVIKVSGNLGDKLHRAEQAIRESESSLRNAQKLANMGSWVLNLIDQTAEWSENCFILYGYKPFEFEPTFEHFKNRVHPDDWHIIDKNIEYVFKNKVPSNYEIRIILPDGTIKWFQNNVVPIFQNDKIVKFAGINIDITERKLAELALKESENQLLQLNVDKDLFISILGHDLKNPFNNLLGLSEVLTEDIRKLDINEIETLANLIDTTARNTYNLLEDILMWARTQQGKIPFKPQNLSFTDVCNDILKNLIPNAEIKNITIDYSKVDHLTVFADIDMLKTVLRNLVSNAIKFTNKKGIININAKHTDSNVTISISDNGIGIAPVDLTKLFDISQVVTTKGTAKETGTGIGLLLCKEFVEKHGGEIWVESEVGRGSDFRFTLPVPTE